MRVLRIISSAAALAALAWLVFGPKPWKSGLGSLNEGDKILTNHHVVTGEWFGAIAILVVAAGVFIGAKWLARPLGDGFRASSAKVPRDLRLLFWGAAILAVGLGGWLNIQRIDQSLWGDEEYTMKRMVVGDWSRGSNDSLRFKPVSWIDTVWRYKNPNNHQLNSVLARMSHEAFHKSSDAPLAMHFTEWALRLPAFIAGLMGIVALGWFLAVMGFPRAGIIAMLILPLHPWFVRYGVESRGYAFTLLLFPLALLLLLKAVRRGRWPYWVGFGVVEALLFFAYPANLYLLLPLNISALLVIFLGQRNQGDRLILTGRWLTANLLAGCLAIIAFSPCVIPMQEYLAKNKSGNAPGMPWIVDNISYLASGLPWQSWSDTNQFAISLSEIPSAAAFPMVWFPVFFFLAGIVRLWSASRQTRLLLLALLLPWFILYFLSVAGGNRVYHWYAVIVLPSVVGLIALGLDTFPSAAPSRFLRSIGTFAMLGLYAMWFSVATGQTRNNLLDHPVGPLRESVALTRDVMNPHLPFDIDQSVVTVGFCMATRGYDPAAYLIKDDDSALLWRILDSAAVLNRGVYVNFALPGLARETCPRIMKIIDNPDYFRVVKKLDGQDEPCTRWIYAWTGLLPEDIP